MPGLEVLDAVQNGSVESDTRPATTSVLRLGLGTLGLTAQQQNAWLYDGGGEALNRLYADFGVLSFPAGNTGAQLGGWFKRQLEGLQSLRGLKMRIPGLGGKVMASLGVNVQVLPGGEIYLALDRGAIDAAEWTGPYDDEKLGLPRAARFYYYPGWWEPGPTLAALVNQRAWRSLPGDYQAMFSTACYEANLSMLSRYDSLNGQALQRLIAGGTQLRTYDDSILNAAQQASDQLFADTARTSQDFKRIYEGWQTFRDQIWTWNRINQLPYASFIYRQSD